MSLSDFWDYLRKREGSFHFILGGQVSYWLSLQIVGHVLLTYYFVLYCIVLLFIVVGIYNKLYIFYHF